MSLLEPKARICPRCAGRSHTFVTEAGLTLRCHTCSGAGAILDDRDEVTPDYPAPRASNLKRNLSLIWGLLVDLLQGGLAVAVVCGVEWILAWDVTRLPKLVCATVLVSCAAPLLVSRKRSKP